MALTVSVIITVKNDAAGIAETLESLAAQSRSPDEIIVVDGGSRDETTQIIRDFGKRLSSVRLIEVHGANIAAGRNIGVRSSHGEIIATTDAGCRADARWLAELLRPFEEDAEIKFVGGFYRIAPRTMLEEVVGLATMRGQLRPVNPETFNPSARSMAMRRELWDRAGGWPEWIRFSEDTLFDHKVRALGVKQRFAESAIVHWRPRSTLRSIGRQFFNYGTGRGHTRIGEKDFHYNLRNFALNLSLVVLSARNAWFALFLGFSAFYFYGYTFHGKAREVSRRMGSWRAYAICMVVMWVVLASNTAGYVVGSWQRLRDRKRYKQWQASYMAVCR